MAWNDQSGTEVSLMPVLNSVWQINDGSIAVFLTNITEEPVDVTVRLKSNQAIIAAMMSGDADKTELEKLDATEYYPLPQNTLALVREQNCRDQKTFVSEGNSERGFNVTVPALKCRVILIGSEKAYGVHNS
jgi:hypothetical protein